MTKEKHFYLIRGLIREKGHWKPLLHELTLKFPQAKITTIDIPGAGDHFKKQSPLSIKGIVEEMRREFLEARSLNEEAHLLAISLGGMIAVEWMNHYPDDFHSAVLINTSLATVSSPCERLKPEALFHLLKVPFLKGREKEGHILKLVSNHQDHFEETLEHWTSIQLTRPVSLMNTLRQLYAAANCKPELMTPKIPLLILASPYDRMVSVNCSRELARRWKVPIKEHPTGGHDLSVDDPEWIALMIDDYLSALSSSSRA